MNTKSKKKVVFVLPTLTAGGAERVLITLMNHLSGRFEPYFVALDESGALKNWIDPNIPFHTLGHRRVRSSWLPLLRKLKALKPDIVVTTMVHTNFLALFLKPFFPFTQFVIREANVPRSMLEVYPPLKTRLIRWGYKVLYPHADLVISPAQCIIDEFETLLALDTANHAVLYNPVDICKISEKLKDKGPRLPSAPDGTVHFVCAGRLHYQKGFDRLISKLGEAGIIKDFSWHLTILGEGDERVRLEKLVGQYELAGRVSFHGLVDNPWAYMAQADCFLLPSRWEGLPNVVLESLACGTPVIAMEEAGGIAEIAALANRLGEKAVQIASTMDDFLRLMADVRPSGGGEKQQTSLPDAFSLGSAVSRFEALLLGLRSGR